MMAYFGGIRTLINVPRGGWTLLGLIKGGGQSERHSIVAKLGQVRQ